MMSPEQIRVNIKFINAECNNFGFDFDNYENEFRNANVIDVVYKLIEIFCTKNIHYSSIKKSKEADELIFLDANRKEEDDKINKEDIFNDLSPISTNYTIYVVFRLLDKPLHQPKYLFSTYQPNTGEMTLSELAGGRGKKQTRNKNKKRVANKRTNKKYCSKCKSKKTLYHKHKYTNKNKNKK